MISLELPQPPVDPEARFEEAKLLTSVGPKAPLLRSGPRLTTALGAAMLAATARRNRFPPDGSNRREMNNAPRDGSRKRNTQGRATAQCLARLRPDGSGFKVAGLKERNKKRSRGMPWCCSAGN